MNKKKFYTKLKKIVKQKFWLKLLKFVRKDSF